MSKENWLCWKCILLHKPTFILSSSNQQKNKTLECQLQCFLSKKIDFDKKEKNVFFRQESLKLVRKYYGRDMYCDCSISEDLGKKCSSVSGLKSLSSLWPVWGNSVPKLGHIFPPAALFSFFFKHSCSKGLKNCESCAKF